MIVPSSELAEAIGFSYKSLKHSTDLGRFSPRMAVALETHLGLNKGVLKRTSDVLVPRMSREFREPFRSLIVGYVNAYGIEKVSRLLEAHYEITRQIVSGTVLPSLLHLRAIANNAADDRFLLWDDPFYVYVEKENILGRRIRDRRVELGITQQQLAAAIGCGNTIACRYEKGRRDIPEEKILLLAQVLQDPELPRIANDLQRGKAATTANDSRTESRANAA